jgi:hypothetical protein
MALIGLGIGTGSGLFKFFHGKKQEKEGKKKVNKLLKEMESGAYTPPEYHYQTPASLIELSNLYAQFLAEEKQKEGMPGQERIEQNLKELAASQMYNMQQAARTSTEALGASVDISGQLTESLQQLEIQGAREEAARELAAIQMYGSVLGQKAEYEYKGQEKEFYHNLFLPWQLEELIPFQTRIQQAQSQYAAGLGNISSGFSDIINMAAMGLYGMGDSDSNGFFNKDKSKITGVGKDAGDQVSPVTNVT